MPFIIWLLVLLVLLLIIRWSLLNVFDPDSQLESMDSFPLLGSVIKGHQQAAKSQEQLQQQQQQSSMFKEGLGEKGEWVNYAISWFHKMAQNWDSNLYRNWLATLNTEIEKMNIGKKFSFEDFHGSPPQLSNIRYREPATNETMKLVSDITMNDVTLCILQNNSKIDVYIVNLKGEIQIVSKLTESLMTNSFSFTSPPDIKLQIRPNRINTVLDASSIDRITKNAICNSFTYITWSINDKFKEMVKQNYNVPQNCFNKNPSLKIDIATSPSVEPDKLSISSPLSRLTSSPLFSKKKSPLPAKKQIEVVKTDYQLIEKEILDNTKVNRSPDSNKEFFTQSNNLEKIEQHSINEANINRTNDIDKEDGIIANIKSDSVKAVPAIIEPDIDQLPMGISLKFQQIINEQLRKRDGKNRVFVRIIKANGLVESNCGNCNAYCLINLDNPLQINTTKSIPNTVNPFWDEEFIFETNNVSKNIQMEVFDKNPKGEELLGKAMLSLEDIRNMPSRRQIIPLTGKPKSKTSTSGSVTVEFVFIDSNTPETPLPTDMDPPKLVSADTDSINDVKKSHPVEYTPPRNPKSNLSAHNMALKANNNNNNNNSNNNNAVMSNESPMVVITAPEQMRYNGIQTPYPVMDLQLGPRKKESFVTVIKKKFNKMRHPRSQSVDRYRDQGEKASSLRHSANYNPEATTFMDHRWTGSIPNIGSTSSYTASSLKRDGSSGQVAQSSFLSSQKQKQPTNSSSLQFNNSTNQQSSHQSRSRSSSFGSNLRKFFRKNKNKNQSGNQGNYFLSPSSGNVNISRK